MGNPVAPLSGSDESDEGYDEGSGDRISAEDDVWGSDRETPGTEEPPGTRHLPADMPPEP